jgi:Fe-S oxidoreductase
MRLESTNREISDAVVGEGATDAFKCYQCGKCASVCPWYLIQAVDFLTYRIPQAVRLGTVTSAEDAEKMAREVEELFRCVACEACKEQCPHGVDIPEIIRSIRKILNDYDAIPPELKVAVGRVQSYGNPLGEPKEKRNDWFAGTGIPKFDGSQEFAFYSCCMTSYDERLKKVARAGAELLKRGGISFGIFADEDQNCCVESVRRVGAMNIFQPLAETNISLFKNAGAKKIVTTSPHCYAVFRREYVKMGLDAEFYHQVQLIHRLIKEKKLVPVKPLNKRVVYHDPCTLGRQSSVYDEPREVLRSIPGIELAEIPIYSRNCSLCCGGGGGGVWLDRPINERFADLRVRQALNEGAQLIAVTCPYCLQMFEDALKRVECDIVIKDVAELCLESLE